MHPEDHGERPSRAEGEASEEARGKQGGCGAGSEDPGRLECHGDTGVEGHEPGWGSGPDTVPTLLSLALMQTWLCVYSLLNVCVRRRKHCRNSKHQSGVSWDQARPRAPPPTTQRPAQVPGTAGQGGSTFRPLRRWGKPGKPPKAGLGLGEDLLGGPQPQNGLGFGWSAPHRCRYSRADKPLLREEAVKGSQNPV